MELAEGNQVTDSLTLVRELGRGGMGAVWIAFHEALDCEVAVKFISLDAAQDESLLARFKREAQAAAKIRSPHIVQMFDHGVTADGTPYIVMELMDGESIAVRLERGPMTPPEVATVLDQVAHALGKAHDAGVVHRDIKPDNLFLVESGTGVFVKVLDFGIAKTDGGMEASLQTATSAVAGTPRYMSPEQLLSTKNVDGRTDLWAMVVVAYQALTGRLPFEADSIPALTLKVFQGEVEPPTALVPELGPAIDAWVAKGLFKDIRGRFQTAAELAASFREAMDADPGEPVEAVASSTLVDVQAPFSEPTPSWLGRAEALHSGPIVTAASGLVSTGGAGPTASSAGRHEQPTQAALGTDTSTLSGSTAAQTPGKSGSKLLALAAVGALVVAAGVAAFMVTRGDDAATDQAQATPPLAAEPDASARLAATGEPEGASPTSGGTAAPSAAVAADATSTQGAAKSPPTTRFSGTTTASSPSPATSAAPQPPAAKRVDCSEPFFRDANGHLEAKAGCL